MFNGILGNGIIRPTAEPHQGDPYTIEVGSLNLLEITGAVEVADSYVIDSVSVPASPGLIDLQYYSVGLQERATVQYDGSTGKWLLQVTVSAEGDIGFQLSNYPGGGISISGGILTIDSVVVPGVNAMAGKTCTFIHPG